jgi:uncharacterized protein
MRIWKAWVLAFLAVWAVLVTVLGYWREAGLHWPISVVMALGSTVGGATAIGGGSVAYPFLVLLFHRPATMGRDFAVAVQAIGMTSAMILMFCRGIRLQGRLLFWNGVGAALGLLAGTYVIAPLVPDTTAKLLFASLWLSYGLLLMVKNREFGSLDAHPRMSTAGMIRFGLTIGVAGGLATSLIGGGLDMMTFAALTLLFRSDLKIGIPHAVSSMAIGSVMAATLHAVTGHVSQEVLFSWLAGAPVALVAAPVGTLILTLVPRVRMVYAVSVLCMIQFVWTISRVHPTESEWMLVAVVIAAALIAFCVLLAVGVRRTQRSEDITPAFDYDVA